MNTANIKIKNLGLRLRSAHLNLKTFLAFAFLLLSFTQVIGQENKLLKTNLSVACTQLPDNQVKLKAKLRVRIDKSYVALPNAVITFININGEEETEIGKEKTNKKGEVEILVNSDKDLALDEEFYYGILANYEGDEKHSPAEGDVLFKGAYLDLAAEVVDSVKTITVQLIRANEEEEVDLEDIDVIVQVPRMFSNLTVATGSTDEDGMVEIEFPDDIPGGENGELTLIASALDTDEFGTLKSEIKKDWALTSTKIDNPEIEKNELWKPNAPLWMVLTFAFLISLVWIHFLIIIYKLYLIKKEGN